MEYNLMILYITNLIMTIVIYQILDNTTGNSYIGSTVSPIKTRMSVHLSNYNKWLSSNGVFTYYTSYEVLKNNDYIVYILELLSDEEVDMRYKRERHYLDTIGNCVNKHIPSRTVKQYYEDHRTEINELMKAYYKKNKERVITGIKDRYKNNVNGYRDKQTERNNYRAIQKLIEKELDS